MLKFIVILSSVDWITKEEGVSSYYTSLLLEMAESAMILEKKKQAKAAAEQQICQMFRQFRKQVEWLLTFYLFIWPLQAGMATFSLRLVSYLAGSQCEVRLYSEATWHKSMLIGRNLWKLDEPIISTS